MEKVRELLQEIEKNKGKDLLLVGKTGVEPDPNTQILVSAPGLSSGSLCRPLGQSDK